MGNSVVAMTVLAAFLLIVAPAIASPTRGTRVCAADAAIADIAKKLSRCEASPDAIKTLVDAACYLDAGDAVDDLMTGEIAAIRSHLKAAGERHSEGAKEDGEIARRFEASQHAWVVYRDAECNFTAADDLGGADEKVDEANCEYTTIEARVKRLAEWLDTNVPTVDLGPVKRSGAGSAGRKSSRTLLIDPR